MNTEDKKKYVDLTMKRLKSGELVSEIEVWFINEGFKHFEIKKIIDVAKKDLWNAYKIYIENTFNEIATDSDFNPKQIDPILLTDFENRIKRHYQKNAEVKLNEMLEEGKQISPEKLSDLLNLFVNKDEIVNQLTINQKKDSNELSEIPTKLNKSNIGLTIAVILLVLKGTQTVLFSMQSELSIYSFVVPVLIFIYILIIADRKDTLVKSKESISKRLDITEKLIVNVEKLIGKSIT